MAAERRTVRVSPAAFDQLDSQLPQDRGPSGEASVGDFIVLELPAVVERFASSFDDLPEILEGPREVRILIVLRVPVVLPRTTMSRRRRGGGDTFATDGHQMDNEVSEKARRREACAVVGAYHQEQLRVLLEHVRDGFAELDTGEIDEFELDDLIHRYKRAGRNLWSFCGTSGNQWLQAATALEYMREHGEEHDWWADSDRSRDRS